MTWSSSRTAALSRAGCRAIGTAAVVVAALPVRLPAQAPPPPIDTILIINRNIFDPDADAPGFLSRLANRLHTRTRAWVIRRALLVNPGESYDSARVAESERALRNLHVFSRVRLDTTRLGGRLALRVATTDGWSTKPQLGYSSAGGSVSWLAGLVEDNLLGTATSLTAIYNKTPDRTSLSFDYISPHFIGRRTGLAAGFSDKSDGRVGTWQLGLPFYETAAPHAFTTNGEAASERVLVFRDAALASTLEHRTLVFGVNAGFAPRATSRDYLRVSLEAQWRREDFAPEASAVIPRSVFGTAGTALDVAHVRFQVLERFNSYARREDVDVSQLLHFGVWVAPRAWGYPSGEAGVGTELGAQLAAPWPGGFAVLRGAGNGVFTPSGPDSGRVSGAVTVASQNLRSQTLILHAEGARLRRPKPGEEFDLWSTQNGPRVFAIHEFTGTRMAWAALEDRLVVADELWGLVAVGVAPFLDYGGAWYADEAARLGGDLGIALRLGPTRSVRGDVAEFALGYRFGAGFTGSRWGFAIRKGVTY